MENAIATPSIYDLCAEILAILYRNDDILFEEDYREVLPKAELLSKILVSPLVGNLLFALRDAKDDCLDQDSLFDAQNAAEDLTREYAEQEHRWPEFYRKFPWM